jgi:methylase of polypeptide subunit release factors
MPAYSVQLKTVEAITSYQIIVADNEPAALKIARQNHTDNLEKALAELAGVDTGNTFEVVSFDFWDELENEIKQFTK